MRSVLVVDDAQEVLDALVDTLRFGGFQVMQARHGREALDVMRTRRPDVVLLDLDMPIMDGFEFNAACKENPRLNSVPIVVMTAAQSTHYSARFAAQQLKAQAYINKPFKLAELLQIINEALTASTDRAARSCAR